MISIGAPELILASILILISIACSAALQLGLQKKLAIAATRTTVQLLLVGLVLKFVFENANLLWVLTIALFMLLVAAWEIHSRQQYRIKDNGYVIGLIAMIGSSLSITLFALLLIVQPEPVYTPQYAIPLLGMLLGNTMNGVSLAMDSLSRSLYEQRTIIETRLCLGQTATQSCHSLRRDAIRVGMIPIINSMAAAGIVSLPGMMTGQILAGAAPIDAVAYQILIMFLIAGATTLGTIIAVQIVSRRLFDERQRLRLDRLNRPD